MLDPILAAYQSRLHAGHLSPDPAQLAAVKRLDALAQAVTHKRKGGAWTRRAVPPKGLYLWGGVGRGKSMLMDLFYHTVPVARKRRVHFHDFMQEVHGFIADWRGLDDKARRKHPFRVRGALADPIGPVAKSVASTARLLCFDEFQVGDITDAMILGRLFSALFAHGVVVVATSNRHPDALYKDGLNRQLFLPFIDLLKQKTDVFELVAARDYRLERLAAAPVWHCPLGAAARAAMDAAWAGLTAGAETEGQSLSVLGRRFDLAVTASGCARLSFAQACTEARGPADYLALARHFDAVLIDDIPILTPDRRNEAKRFVTLIDALYEAKTKLVASAAAAPDALYRQGDGAFEFERTASRLYEMGSRDYLAAGRVMVDALPEWRGSSTPDLLPQSEQDA
jgi:cell division protein ZapE